MTSRGLGRLPSAGGVVFLSAVSVSTGVSGAVSAGGPREEEEERENRKQETEEEEDYTGH